LRSRQNCASPSNRSPCARFPFLPKETRQQVGGFPLVARPELGACYEDNPKCLRTGEAVSVPNRDLQNRIPALTLRPSNRRSISTIFPSKTIIAVPTAQTHLDEQHGNPAGDPSTAPRCGAQTRTGQKCRAPAMRNPKTGQSTRCRMHGGASTGPQTPEGRERCRKARWKHGHRSAAAVAERRRRAQAGRKVRAELRRLEELLRSLRG